MSYDRHHAKHENIYRVSSTFITSEKPVRFAISSPALGPILKREYSDIENFVRIRPLPQILFSIDDIQYYEP